MPQENALTLLYTPWGENLDKACPLNEYPRPQMRRENWLCLNGAWKYAITDHEAAPTQWDGDILVPFSPESLLSGVNRQLLPGQTLWYKRQVPLTKPQGARRRLLHFGAVDQHCRVWCNNQLVGKHSGGYWPFSVDITDALAESGDASITVAVTDDSNSGDEAYGKQVLNRGGIWYTGQSGIWQTVWCEEVPQCAVKSLRITPFWREGAVEVAVRGNVPNGMVTVRDGGITVAEAALQDGIARLAIPNHKSWSPDSPFLYDLQVDAGEDTVHSYFGMREFSVQNGADGKPRLALNGEPIFHNGLLDQGYWSDGMYTPPSDEAIVWEITRLKEMGFNMLRKHIKIEPMRWYYHCDRLGMLVWQDFVSGGGPYQTLVIQHAPWLGLNFADHKKRYHLHGRRSEAGRKNFIRDARRTVRHLYNVPSIAVWVPFNEGWGQFEAAKVCRMVAEMDSTRQIDHASGYFDQGEGHFHSYHIYRKHFHPRKDKFTGRVLALTEFGGYSLPAEGHMASPNLYGYKVCTTQRQFHDELERLYALDIMPAIEKGMGALVYTQVSDVEDEINGLFTYDRQVVKVDVPQLQALNQRVYAAFEESAGV